MDIIKNNLGYVGSIFTVAAYWFAKDISIALKIFVTGIAVIFCILDWINVDRIHLVNYAVDEDTPDRTIKSVIVDSRNQLQVDNMVSLFSEFDDIVTLVAICNIVDSPGSNTLQIDITRRINEEMLNKLKDNQTNIKHFYIVPKVRFVDVKDFLKEEGE